MAKKSGFTLAEVLITLGIIGVVAAMTIPTLIANTNGAKFRSQFKKSISTLSQAGLMGQAQYDFDYAGTSQTCGTTGNTQNPDDTLSFCALFNGTLTGFTYLGSSTDQLKDKAGNAYTWKNGASGASATMGSFAASNYIIYMLADGSMVGFKTTAANCALTPGSQLTAATLQNANASTSTAAGGLNHCLGFIDVNGTTLPNKEVTCGGTTTTVADPSQTCVVPNDAAHMGDVFPVVFHDAIVEPASNAAKYILTTSK